MALRKPGFVLFLMVYSPKDHLGCPIIVCYEVTSTDIEMHGLIIFPCCYGCCYHKYSYGCYCGWLSMVLRLLSKPLISHMSSLGLFQIHSSLH